MFSSPMLRRDSYHVVVQGPTSKIHDGELICHKEASLGDTDLMGIPNFCAPDKPSVGN